MSQRRQDKKLRRIETTVHREHKCDGRVTKPFRSFTREALTIISHFACNVTPQFRESNRSGKCHFRVRPCRTVSTLFVTLKPSWGASGGRCADSQWCWMSCIGRAVGGGPGEACGAKDRDSREMGGCSRNANDILVCIPVSYTHLTLPTIHLV